MAIQTLTNETRDDFPKGKPEEKEEKPVDEVKAEEPEEKPKKRHTVDERLATLAAQKREAQDNAARVTKERDDLKARIEALENAGKPNREPVKGEYTTAEEYADALADWKFRQKMKEREEKDTKDKFEAERQKVVANWNKRYAKISKEYEDFEDVMTDPLDIVHGTVIDAIYESDIGPHINYYLSKNREEAEKINEMGVKAALKYLGRIEAKIETQLAEKDKKEEAVETIGNFQIRKKAIEAPAPIKTIEGKGSTTTGWQDGGSYQDFKAAYKRGQFRQ